MLPPPPRSTLFPYTTLFRSLRGLRLGTPGDGRGTGEEPAEPGRPVLRPPRRQRRRSEEHTSELQSRQYLVCRLLLEKKKTEGELKLRLQMPETEAPNIRVRT